MPVIAALARPRTSMQQVLELRARTWVDKLRVVHPTLARRWMTLHPSTIAAKRATRARDSSLTAAQGIADSPGA
jgi:hypothetical protein